MKYLKSKTIWFGFILSLLSVAQGMLDLITDPMYQAVAGVVVSAGIVVLRIITVEPLSEK